MATKAKKRKCKGTAKSTGKRCKAAPLQPGTVIDGVKASGDFCRPHDPAIPSVTQLTTDDRRRGGEATRRPRPDDILRDRIEEDIDRWLAPIEAALGEGKPIQMWDGEKRQHYIQVVPDPALGLKAIKFAFERAFGRPRQQVELANADTDQPLRISHELLTDPGLRDDLRGLRRRVADARPERPVGAGSGDRSASSD